jgi:hypothetical protein
MRLRRQILSIILPIVLLVSVLGAGGCSLEDGAREGISAGVSGALAAIIQTPVNFALDQSFEDPDE